MKNRERSEERLLLGVLPDAEREELEERALLDRETFELLALAEDELVDARARGELSAADRRRFDATLGGSPRVRERLAVARLLAREADRAAARRPAADRGAAVEPVPRRPSLGEWLAELWRRPSPPLRVALAAAALLLAVGLPLYWQAQRPAPPAAVFSLVLQPSTLRGAAPADRPLAVPAGTERLELFLELDADPGFEVFAAVVADAGGAEVWRAADLRPRRLDWGDAVVIEAPVAAFAGGPFEVRLLGGEAREEVADYRFDLAPP